MAVHGRFETGDPVHEALPEYYIEQMVTAYVGSGVGNQDRVGAAPSLLVDTRQMLSLRSTGLRHKQPGKRRVKSG